VFTAGPPIIEDFEDGNINGWNHVTGAGGGASIANIGFNSNHSIEVGTSTGGSNSVGYFDSFGTKDFTNPFTMSGYIQLDNQNPNDAIGSLGYIYNTSNDENVLVCGIDNQANEFFIAFNNKAQGPTGVASTAQTFSTGTWYEVEFEFDGTDHIGRLYDDTETLLNTLTWSNSSSNAQSSAYVATVHCAAGPTTHQHYADNFALSI